MKQTWLGLLSKLFSLVAICATAHTPLQAQSPACQQIRAACRNAGFVVGGPIGERMVLDCFNPIALGEMPKRPATKPLPQIDPQVLSACKDQLSGKSGGTNAQPQAPVANAYSLAVSYTHLTLLGVTLILEMAPNNGLLWRLSIAVFLLLLAFCPVKTMDAPDWNVCVVDEANQPVRGILVRESYQNYSAEWQGHRCV